MNKAVLISIQPKWCELIASGRKTIEVRKTKPKLQTPFKCYIYCTMAGHKGKYLHTSNKHGQLLFWDNPKDTSITVQPENYEYMAYTCRGKVIGEFLCDEITSGFWIAPFTDYLQSQSCLSYDEVCDYANGKPIFSWHISNLKIYDKPKELGDFYKPAVCGYTGLEPAARPPQSWCYVEFLDDEL